MTRIAHTITIDAPRADVFAALTTVEGLRGWYTPDVDGQPAKGEEITLSFRNAQGPFRWRVDDLADGELVRWQCVDGPGDAPGTTATFRLTDRSGGRTVVDLDHEGMDEAADKLRTCNTLWGALMHHLKSFSEQGDRGPAFG